MNEMIERVAAAMDKYGEQSGCRIPRVMLRHLAVEAIEAMREPTALMLGTLGLYYTNECDDPDFRAAWQSVIDEALR